MSGNPNPGADRLRDPQVTIDEALEILRQVPLWLDIFVMENPAYDLLCLENPFWERSLSVSTLWHMAGHVGVYRDPRCAQLVAKAILSKKVLDSHNTAGRCVRHFLYCATSYDGEELGIENLYERLQMIAEGKTPKALKDFIGHLVK